jgi:hypothetical protein
VSTEVQQLRREFEELKRRQGQPIGDAKDFAAAQSRAEAAYQAIGDSVPQAQPGECVGPYEARLAQGVQAHSPKYKNAKLSGICDAQTVATIAADVYADVQAHALDASQFKPGEMRAITRHDQAGRMITRYVGHEGACWDKFCPPTKFAREGLASFKTGSNRLH